MNNTPCPSNHTVLQAPTLDTLLLVIACRVEKKNWLHSNWFRLPWFAAGLEEIVITIGARTNREVINHRA